MPTRFCKHPSCSAYATKCERFCEKHKSDEPKPDRSEYDKNRRNPESKKFYNSPLWRAVREDVLALRPVCEVCQRTSAEHVHHIIPLSERPDLETELNNLQAVCSKCHSSIEPRRGGKCK
jgi:5-methylcytosine-specific restriction enzyme A